MIASAIRVRFWLLVFGRIRFMTLRQATLHGLVAAAISMSVCAAVMLGSMPFMRQLGRPGLGLNVFFSGIAGMLTGLWYVHWQEYRHATEAQWGEWNQPRLLESGPVMPIRPRAFEQQPGGEERQTESE